MFFGDAFYFVIKEIYRINSQMCLSIRQRKLTGGVALKLHAVTAGINDGRSNIQNSFFDSNLDGPHIQCKILYKQEILPTSGMESQPFSLQHIIVLPALFPVVEIIFCLLMQQILNKYDDRGDIFLCDISGEMPLKMAYNLECFLWT
jgi:hypothetical protein